jgi:hypothetical protein
MATRHGAATREDAAMTTFAMQFIGRDGAEKITVECTIIENGNGLPDVGDYVPGTDGELYQVAAMSGTIHTGPPGHGNYVHATVAHACWDEVDEDEEIHTARARIGVQS